MKKILGFLLGMLPALASAQTATLLPNGQQQFFDNNGAPLSAGTACFYIPSTLTSKLTWQDAGETIPNTTPCVTLDSAGRAVIYGSGTYRQRLLDQNGNLIWDQLSNQLQSSIDVQNGGPFWGGMDTGAVNAYAFTINDPTVTAYKAGQKFQFIPANTNTGAATLDINGIGAPAILKSGTSGPTPLVGNELVVGNIVEVEYDGTEFQVIAGLAPPSVATGIPTGTIASFSITTPPTGWLVCDGSAVSRSTYAALFAVIGTTWGNGDGSTTFNLPDTRGYFLRGYDNGAGRDPGRVFASGQADAFQGHYHTFTGNAGQGVVAFQNGASGPGAWSGGAQSFTFTPGVTSPITDGVNGVPRTAAETRPINIALNYIIKY